MAEPTPRRRRRWIRGLLLLLVLLVAAARIGGQLYLPKLAADQAAKIGLAVAWERLDLSLLFGRFELSEVDVRRVGAPASAPLLHLEALQFDLDVLALCRGRVCVHRVALDGLDATVVRQADGTITLDGWSWPATAPAAPSAPPDPALPVAVAASAAPETTAPAPYDFTLPFEVDQLRIQNVRLHARDLFVKPPLESDVAFDLRVSDVGSPVRCPRLELSLRAPNAVDAIELTGDGMARAAGIQAHLKLTVRGLSAALLHRYAPDLPLDAHADCFGLDLATHGVLAATDRTALALAGSVAVDRLAWTADRDEEFAVTGRVDVASLSAHALDVALACVDLRGGAVRLKSGALRVGGVDLRSSPAAPDAAPAAAPPANASADPFAIRIGELRPTVAFAFRDEQATPPRDLALALHDSAVKHVALDPASAAPPLDVDLRAEAAGGTLALTGTLLPSPTAPNATLTLKLGGLATLARQIGLDSDWGDGTLELHLKAQANDSADRTVVSVALEGVRLADGGRELLALEALRVPTLTRTPAGLSIDRVEVVKPSVALARAADGTLRVAGVNFAGPPASATAPVAPATATAPPPTPSPTPSPSPTPANPAQPAAPARPAFSVGGVTVEGTTIHWDDQRAAPPAQATVGLDVKVGAVDLAAAAPTPFEVVVKVADALEALTIKGSATPDPDRLATELDLAATGIHPDVLVKYVPALLGVPVKDGRVKLHVAAALDRGADGHRAASVTLTQFEVRDGTEGPPFLALEKLAAVAPQIDPAAGPVEVTELSIDGLKVGLPRHVVAPDGTARVEPLAVALNFRERGPWSVWSSDPESLPPLAFDLDVSAEGLARELHFGVAASPFAARPALEVKVDAKGLTGGGFALIAPGIAERVDATGFADGTFTATLNVELDFKRRRPGDFDLRDGFGGTVRLTEVYLRPTPDAAPVAGFDSLEAEIVTMRPRSGDVNLRSIELRNPTANVHRTAAGLDVGGILIKPAPPAPPEPPAAATTDAPPPAAATAAPAAGAPPPRAAEIRCDVLSVSGINSTFTDDTTTPPLVLPFNDLEVEVRRFTTKALAEPLPIQFRLNAAGGPIELAKRDTRSLLGGAIASAAGALTRGDQKIAMERRPACESIEVAGQTTLVKPFNGWARLDLRALELQALRAIAASGVQIHDGVLDSSVDVRMRGADGIAIDSKSTFTWLSLQEPPNGPITTYLKLPAPLDTVIFLLRDKDGQVQVPLSFKIEPDGLSRTSITRVATETLLRLIRDAIASAPMRVVSGALDAVQLSQIPGFDKIPGLDSIPGLDKIPGLGRLFGKSEPKAPAPPIVFELVPGATRLPEEARRQLEPLFAKLRDDPNVAVSVEHQLGSADRARFDKLARPSQDDIAALGTRLRKRRDDLCTRHDALAAEARGAYAMGRTAAAVSATQDLRAIDRELSVAEQALDQVFALHGEITPRDDERLLRRACVMFAELRLADLRDLFDAAGIEDLATRLDIRPVRALPAPDVVNSRIVIRTRAQQ